MQAVYADWAKALGELSLGAIDHGVNAAGDCPHPPSRGEFKALCQAYKPAMPLMIESKLSPEQIAVNKKRIADISAMLAARKSA